MKRNVRQELRGKTVKELGAQAGDLRRELFDGRSQQATEGKKLGLRGRRLRRDIARCLTLINEKRRNGVQG